MNRLLVMSGLVIFLLAFTGSSWAYSVTVNFEPGETQTIPGVAQPSDGATMAGMELIISGETAGGIPYERTEIWQVTGPVSGGYAPGPGFGFTGIIQSGDTWTNNWGMSYLGDLSHLISLTIDAFAGNTVFDTAFGDEEGKPNTPGSGLGKTFQVVNYSIGPTIQPSDIVVTYRDLVAVDGQAPVGDLYRYLDISFVEAVGFRGQPGILEFIADTDSIILTPVPPTAWLFGLGLAALGLASRKRSA